jgi:hypothetical protein
MRIIITKELTEWPLLATQAKSILITISLRTQPGHIRSILLSWPIKIRRSIKLILTQATARIVVAWQWAWVNQRTQLVS